MGRFPAGHGCLHRLRDAPEGFRAYGTLGVWDSQGLGMLGFGAYGVWGLALRGVFSDPPAVEGLGFRV